MSISPATIYAAIQGIKFLTENLQAGLNGEKTDEEVMAGLENMHENVREASAGWRAARET